MLLAWSIALVAVVVGQTSEQCAVECATDCISDEDDETFTGNFMGGFVVGLVIVAVVALLAAVGVTALRDPAALQLYIAKAKAQMAPRRETTDIHLGGSQGGGHESMLTVREQF